MAESREAGFEDTRKRGLPHPLSEATPARSIVLVLLVLLVVLLLILILLIVVLLILVLILVLVLLILVILILHNGSPADCKIF